MREATNCVACIEQVWLDFQETSLINPAIDLFVDRSASRSANTGHVQVGFAVVTQQIAITLFSTGSWTTWSDGTCKLAKNKSIMEPYGNTEVSIHPKTSQLVITSLSLPCLLEFCYHLLLLLWNVKHALIALNVSTGNSTADAAAKAAAVCNTMYLYFLSLASCFHLRSHSTAVFQLSPGQAAEDSLRGTVL